jgi:hypothetical protein
MLFHIFCDLFGNLRVNSKTVKERAYSSLVRPKLEWYGRISINLTAACGS